MGCPRIWSTDVDVSCGKISGEYPGMVGHIEQPAIRRQGTAPRFGAHRDRLHHPEAPQADDRDGAANAIRDICLAVVGVDRHAPGLEPDGNLIQLDGDIQGLRIFDSDDGHPVGLAVDHDEPGVVGGERDGARVAWGGRCLSGDHAPVAEAHGSEQRAANEQGGPPDGNPQA
jgi:hypothetical protein